MTYMKKMAYALVVATGLTSASLISPAVANACQWTPAWFFLGHCPPAPAAPPVPPEQRKYHPISNPAGYPWTWELNGIHHCPPECL